MGDVFSLDSNRFLVSEIFDFSFRPAFDGIGFAIEVLFKLGKSCQVEYWFFQTGTHVGHPIATSSVAVVSTVSAAAATAAGVAVCITI